MMSFPTTDSIAGHSFSWTIRLAALICSSLKSTTLMPASRAFWRNSSLFRSASAQVLRELDGFVGRHADDPMAPAPSREPRNPPEMALDGEPLVGRHLDHAQAPGGVHRVRPRLSRLHRGAQDVVAGVVGGHRKVGNRERFRRPRPDGRKVGVGGVEHVDARRLLFRRGTGLAEPGAGLDRDEVGHGEVPPRRSPPRSV